MNISTGLQLLETRIVFPVIYNAELCMSFTNVVFHFNDVCVVIINLSIRRDLFQCRCSGYCCLVAIITEVYVNDKCLAV